MDDLEHLTYQIEHGLEAAFNHRGITVSGYVEAIRAWLEQAGDTETLEYVNDESHFRMYGVPIFFFVARRYGIPIDDDDVFLQNMAQGKPCSEFCDNGCFPRLDK